MDAETHHIPEKKRRGVFQWRSGGWEAEACTPPGVWLKYL